MQQPSSLIFLVIIAVWAVYFVQYWVRRREHLATARSVDQFSESLRVLERRAPLAGADRAAAVRPSYAVSPARAARPTVLDERVPAGPASSSVARPVAGPTPAAAAHPIRPARKVRGLVLLASLAAVPVLAVCWLLGLVPVWAVPAAIVAVPASVAWLRGAVRAERAARVSARPQARRPAARAAVPAPAVAAADARAGRRAEAPPGESTDDEDASATRRSAELYDGAAVDVAAPSAAEAAPVVAPRPLVDEDDIPLTWDPVPVPPPTYTMKARVTRPAPTSADLVGDADTEYADGRHPAEPVRRAAGA